MTSHAIAQFLIAMQSRELMLLGGKSLIADGDWHRCAVTNKPNGKTDGSYKLHTDGPVPWGLYRNWTDGKGVDHWRGDQSRPLTEAEQQELLRRMEQARIEDAKQALERAEQAAVKARYIWDGAQPAPEDHPYLQRKGIKPHGARLNKYGRLLVPMYDPSGEIVNLQMIADDGQKWFLRGGRAKGCFSRIPGSLDLVVVTEGFATGASVNQAIGCCVAVAFSAGNLSDVAGMIRGELQNADASLWEGHRDVAAQYGLQHAQRPKFINSKLVIGADDDWKTKNNPGLFHALTAARNAHALIAIPKFGDEREDSQTDFNDMAQAKGPDAVKVAIDKAVEPGELLQQRLLADPHSAHGEEMVKQLAALKHHDTVAYEKLMAELRKAKVRIRPLEKEVKAADEAALAETADDAETADLHEHWTVTPWDQPVDTGELLRDITEQIQSYVATLGERAIMVALWIMFTWVHEFATHSPSLLVTSAEPDCGKTTLLGLVGFMARRALLTVNVSGAALFRSLSKWAPTFIVDEGDTALVDKPDLKEVVNSGWTRNQGVIRCDPETNEPRLYSTFAPKAIGMKGRKLPDTTLSRSIIMELKRKSANETVRDFTHLDDEALVTIRRKLARWANDNAETLRTAKPEMPATFHNRRRMNYWPLFAIAELAGAKEAAWKAAETIEGKDGIDKATLGQKLLADIRDIFDQVRDQIKEGILSRDLITLLTDDPEKPWAEYRHDKPLTQRQLAWLLSQFGITSENIHPENAKGYKRANFDDAFARYLSAIPEKPPADPHIRTNPSAGTETTNFRSAQKAAGMRIENERLAHSPNDLCGCADRKGVFGEKKKKARGSQFEYRVNREARTRRVLKAVEQIRRRKARTRSPTGEE